MGSLSKHYSITGAKKADSVADNFVAQGTFVFLLSTMIKLEMFSFGNNKWNSFTEACTELFKGDQGRSIAFSQLAHEITLYCLDEIYTELRGIIDLGLQCIHCVDSTHIWKTRARWRWLFYPELWIGRALVMCLRSVNFYNGYEQKGLKLYIQRSRQF